MDIARSASEPKIQTSVATGSLAGPQAPLVGSPWAEAAAQPSQLQEDAKNALERLFLDREISPLRCLYYYDLVTEAPSCWRTHCPGLLQAWAVQWQRWVHETMARIFHTPIDPAVNPGGWDAWMKDKDEIWNSPVVPLPLALTNWIGAAVAWESGANDGMYVLLLPIDGGLALLQNSLDNDQLWMTRFGGDGLLECVRPEGTAVILNSWELSSVSGGCLALEDLYLLVPSPLDQERDRSLAS
jgi:hypothetical protein